MSEFLCRCVHDLPIHNSPPFTIDSHSGIRPPCRRQAQKRCCFIWVCEAHLGFRLAYNDVDPRPSSTTPPRSNLPV